MMTKWRYELAFFKAPIHAFVAAVRVLHSFASAGTAVVSMKILNQRNCAI